MIKKMSIISILGGTGYVLIELLWRGRSHFAMFLAGGICLVLLFAVASVFKDLPLIPKALIGGLSVTAVELVFGVAFNIILNMRIWDYSGMKFNFLGQICPAFSLVWCGLSLLLIPSAEWITERFNI